MRDWNSVAALGVFLGMADACRIVDHVPGHPGAGRLLDSMASAVSQLGRTLPPGGVDDLLETLAGTDFDGLAGRDGDRRQLLSTDLYRRLTMQRHQGDSLPPFDAFDRYFREYLQRFASSVTAVLYATGIRHEIVSMENPAARDCVEELRRLPCRAFGALKPAKARESCISASLSKYVQSLLDRHAEGTIEPACRAGILDILDHLSAYPGYYRLVERERKVEAAQTLISAISALQKPRADDREKADLMAALGILLFNVIPSPGVVRYLAVHSPGGGNRLLRYEHNALMAMNLLLMGKRAAAAGYCRRANDAAPDADLKAYACMLEGCIALDGRDYKSAAAALEKALEIADQRQLRSLAGFYLGIVHYEEGRVGLALNCFRDARIGAEAGADAMAACNNTGTCFMVLGDMSGALRSFEEADAMATYPGDGPVKFNRAVAAGNAGIVYLSMREYEHAREHFAKALRASRETGNARGVADQLMNIGLAHKGMGNYASASDHFVSAMNYACTIDYQEGVLYAREQIGQALALQGKHDAEADIYRDIARRHPGTGDLLTRR